MAAPMLEMDDDGVMAEINMTPLVDVMLVLLIIFMITMPVITRQIDVSLPSASTAAPAAEPDVRLVQVRADGQWTLDGDQVSEALLRHRLSAAVSDAAEVRVHLAGDKSVAYGEIMQAMDVIRAAGVTRLGFVTGEGGE